MLQNCTGCGVNLIVILIAVAVKLDFIDCSAILIFQFTFKIKNVALVDAGVGKR